MFLKIFIFDSMKVVIDIYKFLYIIIFIVVVFIM